MIFENVYVEKDVADRAQTQLILRNLEKFKLLEPGSEKLIHGTYNQYFGATKKPYLQKRTNLNLFIAQKKGLLVKPAPPAYGASTNKQHYYFVHSYNCIYECEYCYLQGYFHSPDLVFFINHEEVIEEMTKIIKTTNEETWFHAGEFSDSLALSHITNEFSFYWPFFKTHRHATLELRTKSANVSLLAKTEPLSNVVVSFSMSPIDTIKEVEHKTAPLMARIEALSILKNKGFQLGLHFDPIIYSENIFDSYRVLIQNIVSRVTPDSFRYISIGVVRFTPDVYHQMNKNYPQSKVLNDSLRKGPDEKVKYSKPFRQWILKNIRQVLLDFGFTSTQIYECME